MSSQPQQKMRNTGHVDLDHLLRMVSCYRNVDRIKRDVMTCSSQVSTLVPKVGKLMHNNGLESELLVLGGTIPIRFQSNQYNIPVEIFISEPYPDAPPRCYVRPTRDMELKLGHRHVDREGLVYLPYLHEWTARSHNLVELCAAMSSVFSQDPPVFAVRRSSTQSPTPGYAGYSAMRPPSQSYSPGTPDRMQPPPPYEAVTRPNPPSQGNNSSLNPAQLKAQAEVRRRDTVQQVTQRVRVALQDFYGKVKFEIDEEYDREAKLQDGKREIAASLALLRKLKEQMQEEISVVAEREQALDAWLAEQSGKPEQRVEDLVEAVDPPSKQMLELVSQNAALEDALYHLDKAVASGSLDLPTFLKKVREMSRDQFMCVAHINKIYRAQQVELVANRPFVGPPVPSYQTK